MILVTTATGHLGTATIDFLLQKGTPAGEVAGLARDPKKATAIVAKGISVRQGDYHDYNSLLGAFQGVTTLVFISSGDVIDRVAQHTNVINAAKAAGVQHIVYTSVVRPTPDMKFTAGIDHYHTEALIKASGIAYTFMRNAFYTDLLPAFIGHALQTGDWYFAAGDAKVNFATRTDMAEALAIVAMQPARHKNATYEITAAKSYSFHEIAGVVNNATGKTVNYVPISIAAHKEGLEKAGLPTHAVALYTSVAESISAGELDVTDSALENILQRKPVDLKDYLPQLLSHSN